MTTSTAAVIGGVDTHKHTHYAAVIDANGRLLGHQEFPATDPGYARLLAWMRLHGRVEAIGVESTGSFGATLTRWLTKAGTRVIEVNRPNRSARRMDGKSDRLDAEQIARSVLGLTATATPKSKSGMVEVIRTLRVTRASAVKSRTQAFNTLFGVMIGAPSPLRDELVPLTKRTLVNRCLRLRPEVDDLLELAGEPERLLLAGVKTALRDLARRWKTLDTEIKALNHQIQTLVTLAAPELVGLFGVGVELAGQFLMTAGDNPDRIRSEAAFAKLCGVAPPTSQQRPNQRPPPAQPQRRPSRQQRPVHRHHRPDAPPHANPCLPRSPHRRRPQQTRDHPLPQALHRTRDLRRAPTINHTHPTTNRLTT
jgi:transposase